MIVLTGIYRRIYTNSSSVSTIYINACIFAGEAFFRILELGLMGTIDQNVPFIYITDAIITDISNIINVELTTRN